MKKCSLKTLGSFAAVFALLTASDAPAHCDTLDGPVVADARIALQKGDVTPVLKWVEKVKENEVRKAFAAAMKERAGGKASRDRAETRFFETLIRVHRAGEGETFTGLKPAGTADPAFVAADKSLAEGSLAELSDEITASVREGLRQRFREALEKKKHANDSVEAGRAYVAAYVAYAHYVEAIHAMAAGGPGDRHRLHSGEDRRGE